MISAFYVEAQNYLVYDNTVRFYKIVYLMKQDTIDALAWHETVHIGDSRENPSVWSFTKDRCLGTTDANFKNSETKAYKSQYSFDNKSLIYTNGALVSKLSEVIDWVKFHGFDKK